MISQIPFQTHRRALVKEEVRKKNIKFHDFLKYHKGSLLLFLMSDEYFECTVVGHSDKTVDIKLTETGEVKTIPLTDVCEFEFY